MGTEECDDNNSDSGDGCSSGCIVEDGWNCVSVPSDCDAVCPDGMIRGDEWCDDDNAEPTDGCD